MSSSRWLMLSALALVVGPSGCCRMCERWCPNCHPPVQVVQPVQAAPACPPGCQPAYSPPACPPGCQPAYSAPIAPVPAVPPPQGWQRTGYTVPGSCGCSL